MHDWTTPTFSEDICRFLGLTGFYQKFITNYAKKAKPPTRLLRKTNPFRMDRSTKRIIQYHQIRHAAFINSHIPKHGQSVHNPRRRKRHCSRSHTFTGRPKRSTQTGGIWFTQTQQRRNKITHHTSNALLS